MTRHNSTKARITRRVRAIVNQAVCRSPGPVRVRMKSSGYQQLIGTGLWYFTVDCVLTYGSEPLHEESIRVGVARHEVDDFLAINDSRCIERIAAEILATAIPLIVNNAVNRANAGRGASPHTKPVSPSRRGAA